jgi:hypothetical protein
LIDTKIVSMGRVPLTKNFEDADSRFNLNEVKQRWWFYTASPFGAVCVPCFLRHVALNKAGRRPTGVSNPARDSCKLLEHAVEKHSADGVTYPKGEAAFFGRYLQKQMDEKQWLVPPSTAATAPMPGTNEEEQAGGGRRIVAGGNGAGLGGARRQPPSASLGEAAAAPPAGAVNAAPDEASVSNDNGGGGGDPSGGTARAPSGDDRDDDFPTGGDDDDDDDDRKRKRRRTTEDEQEASTFGSDTSSRDDASVVPFDTRHLRKKYKYADGQVARVWNDTAEEIEQLGAWDTVGTVVLCCTHTHTVERYCCLLQLSHGLYFFFFSRHPASSEVIAYPENIQLHQLPNAGAHRIDPHECETPGIFAAAVFNVKHRQSDYPSCMTGVLEIPPRGIKDPDCVGRNPQICVVLECQPDALEVAYGDPDDVEGSFNPATATRFFLRPHTLFRIPPGNCYRLENHSETDDATVMWTLLRHRNAPGGGGGGQQEGDGIDNEGGGGSGEPAASAARGEGEG